MKALILAAGYATRLYPLTKDKPKPLLKIGDKTIVDYLLTRISDIKEIDTVYIVTNKKFYPIFRKWADETNASKRYPQFQIKVINDGTESNETRLGAIADILFVLNQEQINDDLLVAAGDNIFCFNFQELKDLFNTHQCDVIVAHRLQDKKRLQQSGVVELDENNKVIGFQEKPQEPQSDFIAPALYIYKKETLPLFKQYIDAGENPDAPGSFISWLYKRKPVYAYIMTSQYYDIGTLESYQAVVKEFEKKSQDAPC